MKIVVILILFALVFLISLMEFDIFTDEKEAAPIEKQSVLANDNTPLPKSSAPDFGSSRCPQGMVFVPGGETVVVYSGKKWNERRVEKTRIDDFCIDQYEASLPDATDKSMGSWDESKPIPPAQSVAGVISWSSITWNQAVKACALAGKRLPTLAEWQTAYSGYDGAAWPWGNKYKDNTCYWNKPKLVHLPAGGCCNEVCKGEQCFITCDMPGSLSEWIDGYWDEDCYGKDQVLCAGGSITNHDSPNVQYEDPEHPGCWKFELFAQTRDGLHHHPKDMALDDDGFRCVAKPR